MKRVLIVLSAVMLGILTGCGGRDDFAVKLPTLYNCSVGIVETSNSWKDSELRQGVDLIVMKRLGKAPVDGREQANVDGRYDFTRTVFANEKAGVTFSVSYFEAALIVDDAYYVCTAID